MFPALTGYHLPTCGVGHVRRAIGRTQIPPNCLTACFADLENEDWDQLCRADELILSSSLSGCLKRGRRPYREWDRRLFAMTGGPVGRFQLPCLNRSDGRPRQTPQRLVAPMRWAPVCRSRFASSHANTVFRPMPFKPVKLPAGVARRCERSRHIRSGKRRAKV
jgi:hypothetical protein